eukprot:TRINITY_DN13132_c0_g1_i1.p1 TRINITY_DN13132_c0_g1~~TRINITY_DN13132_c0_g1_i1.p1  ORF type:complete len:411 (+),score=60.36 TRINITY_DN13132_c0_g1_i1:44-1276(+)
MCSNGCCSFLQGVLGGRESLASRRRSALRSVLLSGRCNKTKLVPVVLEPARLAAPYTGQEPVCWERVQIPLPEGSLTASPPITILLATPPRGTDVVRRPAILLMHETGSSKEVVAEHLERYAQRGFVAASFDARFHGERALPNAGIEGGVSIASLGPALQEQLSNGRQRRLEVYFAALVDAWCSASGGHASNLGTRPFLYDNVADAICVLDYLCLQRDDVNPLRVGVTGVSLGGMHAWLLAAADERVAAVAPAIGVHSFRWAVDHNAWGGRVDSIRPLFEAAAKDLGREAIDSEVVQAVWRRIVPGLVEDSAGSASAFDAPASLSCIAPRPMLVLSGEMDPRCPLDSVQHSMQVAAAEYQAQSSPGRLRLFVEAGVGHTVTPRMWQEIDRFLEASLRLPPPVATDDSSEI